MRSNSMLMTGLLFLALVALSRANAADVPIVVPAEASPVERLAGAELAGYLGRLYPRDRFVAAARLPNAGQCIIVGCATNPSVQRLLKASAPAAPESFVVTAIRDGPSEIGVIAGADPRGVFHGVHALLEKLGCGFYLSCDALPEPRREPFSFAHWQLADRPLVRDRLVFDWHNFLSGCSTWNLEHWQSWIRQSQKMGYNAVMVHAYGNNPMVSFQFNGRTKPVGYLSTTAKGRDWSTMHVNDVRRLWGGGVFKQPVFGAGAALAPDDQRAAAAQELMQGVFAYAGERAMEVYFADDVDTGSANPQELILTLPEGARFAVETKAGGLTGVSGDGDRKFWLANPETPEGYRYYRAQVEALLAAYPQITCLVVWFRAGGTPWMEMKVAEMPMAWQREYEAELARTPEAAKLWHAPQIFAVGKIVRAFDRALKELGRERVQLASGTWRFDFLAPCHRFFPPHVKLIGLDYNVLHDQPQLGDDASRQVIREVAAHRPVVPVIWAHHDDGNYIGRPYTPFPEFYSKLSDARASGFGIIHWTTRPLDLYFTSHAKQVWQRTQDQPLRATCEDMAVRSFGPAARDAMGAYLERWVTDAPKFARETSDWFIDRQLTNIAEVVAGCRARLKLIGAVDETQLGPAPRDRLNYFRGLEEFIIAFHQSQGALQDAQAMLKQGDLVAARQAMAACRPEPVIEQFAKFSSLGGMTRGEQGLVVSLNLRWLPHVLRYRQALGLEPVRLSFGPTSHDPLAQSAGKFTFDIPAGHEFWLRWGGEETGGTAWTLPRDAKVALEDGQPRAWEEICRRGIESGQPIQLRLQPILRAKGQPAVLPAGRYRLRLLFAEPQAAAATRRIFEVAVGADSKPDRVELARPAGQPARVVERRYEVSVGSAGQLAVALTPVEGKALICGAVLEPVVLALERQSKTRVNAAPVGDLFSPAAIAGLLRQANQYQVEHPVMKPPNRNWQQGTWYTGVMAAAGATGDPAFLDQARRWSEEHGWQPGTERSGGNILTCTQTYLELCFLKTNRACITPTIEWLDSGRTNTPSGAKVWYLEGGRRYADSLYVGAPPLAMLAKATGDRKYLDWMNAFFWDVHGEIFDEAEGLFYRDKRFIGQTTANGKKVLWSRGNGWVFASLPRILAFLPADDPGRPRFVALFQQMAASLAKRQGADGLWRPNLDDPDEFSMPESSGTGFFCYGFAWGVRTGVLDRATYLPVVQKAWKGLAGCVTSEGKVQWGQLVGDRPVAVRQEDSHEYVTGTLLLAGSEVLRLVRAGVLPERSGAEKSRASNP